MRRRLAVLSLAVTALVVIAFIVPLALLVRNQAANRALSAAESDAQALAAALAVVGGADGTGDAIVTEDGAQAVIDALPREGISIIFPDGEFRGAPYVDSPNIAVAREGRAFTATTSGGVEVLVPVLGADTPAGIGTVVVRAFVPDEELTSGVLLAWLMLGGLGVFLIAVAIIAADRLGRSIVRPVSELSSAARRLGGGDLETRVDPSGPPEIADVGEAFNFLAGRLGGLLAAERESVADLSHRLRTPLTALRLQAETLRDPTESGELLADIDRVERAIDRLIVDARRPSESLPEPAVADLAAVVRHRGIFWKVLADEQNRPASVKAVAGPLLVGLASDELGALIDTLIENVFAHTDPGVGYSIEAAPGQNGLVSLIITDNGPGFDSEAAIERGTSGAGSTGLGLDIARKAALRTGGDLVVSRAPGGGARVEVLLGRG